MGNNPQEGKAMSTEVPNPNSPRWTSTFKMIIGLTTAALMLALLIYFRSIIGPLLVAFILVYLLHPIAVALNTHTRLSWRTSVSIIYLILLILVITTFTLTGLAIVQQIQSLIKVIENFITNLPTLIDNLSKEVIMFGPYRLDLSQYTDLGQVGNQLINTLQSLIGRAGTLVGTLATATATTIGWVLFIIVVSYFILADAGKVPNALDYINIPGYAYDIQRMSSSIGRIWNVFLRGQLLIVILVIISYSILLSILGVRYAFAIAILAGLARFVPYVGPLITYIVMALVTLFQGGNYFHMVPFYYTLMTIALSVIMDQIFDNLVSPRIMGRSLGVHPAAVLIVAIIAANLIGLIGLLLAAPGLATALLLGRYVIRKMFDRDPWIDLPEPTAPSGFPWIGKLINRAILWMNVNIFTKIVKSKERG
jgi:predicted PurR-regulated permease PerM